MKRLTIILSILIFISCTNYDGEIIIDNASKDTVVLIKSTNKNPSVLVLNVMGTIDADATVNSVVIPKGKINKKIFLDSYSKNAEIHYEHKNVESGSLKIKYLY